MEITKTGNAYLFGKWYNPDGISPCPNADMHTNGIVIYTSPVKYHKFVHLGSLEGIFICDDELDNPMNNVVIPRNEMKEFEQKYHGQFFTFKDHSPFPTE
ncbi:Uncharacterised protein [uncultured archaeon]|nr:Uncharacterised protein [uncultured archaeon]